MNIIFDNYYIDNSKKYGQMGAQEAQDAQNRVRATQARIKQINNSSGDFVFSHTTPNCQGLISDIIVVKGDAAKKLTESKQAIDEAEGLMSADMPKLQKMIDAFIELKFQAAKKAFSRNRNLGPFLRK